MAGACVATCCLLLAFALVPTSVVAATLGAEKRTMRRETPLKVHLSAQGKMVQTLDSDHVRAAGEDEPEDIGEDEPEDTDQGANPKTLVKTRPSDDDLATEFCDYDFPMGKEGTNNCTHPANQSLILQENMCIEAGRQSGATTSHDSFKEPAEWQYNFPKGCFKHSCSEAANNVCYFYNGNGDWPGPKLTGTPVCSRPKHLNGTKNSAAAGGGCPTGYKVIDDEETCSAAAVCLGYCSGSEFRIGQQNASQHRDYPRGCFIHNTEGCVYYNGPSAQPPGTSVQGTPICNVSAVTSWPASASAAPSGAPPAKPANASKPGAPPAKPAKPAKSAKPAKAAK